jgi:hypothetical protein
VVKGTVKEAFLYREREREGEREKIISYLNVFFAVSPPQPLEIQEIRPH